MSPDEVEDLEKQVVEFGLVHGLKAKQMGALFELVVEHIEREREACAKVVDGVAWSSPSADTEYAMREVAKVAALEIRKRNY